MTSLPSSPEAERGLAGSMLQMDRAGRNSLFQIAGGDDCYDIHIATVVRTMEEMDADGLPVNLETVSQRLSVKSQPDGFNWPAYVTELVLAAPTTANAEYFARIVVKCAVQRRFIAEADELKARAADPSADVENIARESSKRIVQIGERACAPNDRKPWIQFLSPADLAAYEPPAGYRLAGDNHVTRGAVFVIGGAPGVGKSRAGVALAFAGATGQSWLGLPVHRQFRSMILQNENGRIRLKEECAGLDSKTLAQFVRISPPPPFGLAFDRSAFCDALASAVLEFKPDVFLVDPWNAAARDDKARDYLDTFELIRSVLPSGDDAPALGIVAHTRKPRADERASGRALLNLLAGSYVLGSVPRSVFVLQAASDDPTDDRVVWTCCKNNDGPLGPRSAWHRRNGPFDPCPDFDWQEFDAPPEARKVVTTEDLEAVFESGRLKRTKKAAVDALRERTGCGHSAVYSALALDGKFKANLREKGGLLAWKA